MRLHNRMNVTELEQLVQQLQLRLTNQYLQNIYHFEDKWLLKWSGNQQIVYDRNCLWVGGFPNRETKIHSICTKLRKELQNAKCLDVFMPKQDKTIYFVFHTYYLVFEFFARGNMLLVSRETNKIVLLTRIHEDVRHHATIQIASRQEAPSSILPCKIENQELLVGDGGPYPTIWEGLEAFWLEKTNIVAPKKEKRKKATPQEQLAKQTNRMSSQMEQLSHRIESEEALHTDFQTMEKLCQERKALREKLKRAENRQLESSRNVPKSTPKLPIVWGRWYHDYHWWFTKHGFLVVGGRNAEQNEKLVKTYLRNHDNYFHIDDAVGGGSFILFQETDANVPDVDYDETAEGVFALSHFWNQSRSGKVYHVKGVQVSKSPESGEFVTKGSFIVRGKRTYIHVQNTILGYCLTEDRQLMLAPFRIIQRHSPECHIKISPGCKKWKGKAFIEKAQALFRMEWKPEYPQFQKSCLLSYRG